VIGGSGGNGILKDGGNSETIIAQEHFEEGGNDVDSHWKSFIGSVADYLSRKTG
jgi:hypothetical protein